MINQTIYGLEKIQFDATGNRITPIRISWFVNHHYKFVQLLQNAEKPIVFDVTSLNLGHSSQEFKDGKMFLRVVTIVEAPFVTYDANSSEFNGFCIELLQAFAAIGDFDYNVTLVGDGLFGDFDEETNAWNGMVGSLVRDEADLIVAPLTVTAQRKTAVSFLPAFLNIGIKFVYRRESQPDFEYNPFAFMSPFTLDLYLAIVISVVLVASLLNFLSKISPYGNRGHFFHKTSNWNKKRLASARQEAERGMCMSNALYFTWAALFWQSPDTVPRSMSQRVLTVAWYLCSVVLVAHYTANMVSALSRHERPKTTWMDSVADLMSRTDYDYGTVANSSVSALMREVNLGYDVEKDDVVLRSFDEGIEKSMAEKFAFFWDSVSLEHSERQSGCKLRSVSNSNFPGMQYAFAVSKNFPHLQEFSSYFEKLVQRGYVRALSHKYEITWQNLCDAEADHVRQLTVSDLAGIFYLMAAGMLVGTMVLMLEWLSAAYHDVHYKEGPFAPDTMEEALRIRLQRFVIIKKKKAQ